MPIWDISATVNQVVGGERDATRRDELVGAAFGRVAEVGFEGLRLRQVAEEVGIDHSTVHHHFPTKQDLIEAVARHATSQLRVTAPPEGAHAGSRLQAHLDALCRLIEQRPELFTVTAELDLRARRDPAVRAVVEEQEAGWRSALVMVFAAAGSEAPAVAAELVIAVVKGVRLAPALATPVFAQLVVALTRGGHVGRDEGER